MRTLRLLLLIGTLLAGIVNATLPAHAAPEPSQPPPTAISPTSSWLPDLTPILMDTCKPICSQEVVVVNRGNVPAPKSITTVTTRDSGVTRVDTIKVPTLAPGASYSVYVLSPFGLYADCVTILADGTTQVRELDEKNNRWQHNPFGLCPAA